ncbi:MULTISPECIES: hypothetical protein [unclassified Synechococcus]|uniref:hypothetical protein n=1 Tax=unclassified Synechococcus TaxID=2626047 RepID=UPI001FDF2C6A|nr:hypothetical protein [Synechococcus sp. WH 8020]
MTHSTPHKKQVVVTLVAVSLMLSGGAVQAGLLQPLLQLMRPRLESQLADQCQQLAQQALRDAELDFEPLSSIGEQPCQAVAKPVSECLIRETSRSGRELGVISELLSGRIGDDAEVVIKRCLASLLGLQATDLQDVPLSEVFQRLRP